MCDKQETGLENVKVGDKVWDLFLGWGEVGRIDPSDYTIRVDFALRAGWYHSNGRAITSPKRTLFWDEVKIVPPPKPKRKVKKEKEVFIGLDGEGKPISIILHKEAVGIVSPLTVRGTLTYEVEE